MNQDTAAILCNKLLKISHHCVLYRYDAVKATFDSTKSTRETEMTNINNNIANFFRNGDFERQCPALTCSFASSDTSQQVRTTCPYGSTFHTIADRQICGNLLLFMPLVFMFVKFYLDCLFFCVLTVFSSPEPKAQVSYCHSAPSVVLQSVRKFSHFRLLLWNRWTEFNKTWQEARSKRPLPSLCFSGRSEKQDGRPGLWLAETFSTPPLKPLNRIQQTWQETRSQRPLLSLCFSGQSEKQDGRPGPWLAETLSTISLKPLNGIQWNLTGSKILKPSTKFVFFGLIGKTRWPPLPLIGRDIFDFSFETAEPNSTELDRKQDLSALYQVCVFRADRKSKMAAPTSDWLRHFRLLCRNRWKEFNKTWQEARSQRSLPSLSFSGRSEKQDGRLASYWLRHFRLLLWNRWMEFNETWQEARSKRPLPSLCFSGRSEEQDGPPRLCFSGQSGKSAHGTAHALRCLARSTQGRIQGRAKIGDGAGGGEASSRKCFFRLKGYSNKQNV